MHSLELNAIRGGITIGPIVYDPYEDDMAGRSYSRTIEFRLNDKDKGERFTITLYGVTAEEVSISGENDVPIQDINTIECREEE